MSVVYVAGPLGTQDPFSNAGRAIKFADRMRAAGWTCIVPHLNSFWAAVCPGVPYEEWLRMDLELVTRCDLLVRLPGASPGADKEVEQAKAHGIPVQFIDDPETDILEDS
jgi:hypothetical protein